MFISSSVVSTLACAFAGRAGYVAGNPPERISALAGKDLERLRGEYRRELFEDMLPAWFNGPVDEQHGGIMVNVSRDGTLKNTYKAGYYVGRHLYMMSRIYADHGQDERCLENARKTWEFMNRHSWDEQGDYYRDMTRDGVPLSAEKNIFADIYGAYGEVAYYNASGDGEALDRARKTIIRTAERVLDPSFRNQYSSRPPYEPGTSWFGVWLHLLPVLTSYLNASADDDIEAIARLSVRRIMQDHRDRANQFVFEVLDGRRLLPYPEMEHHWVWACHVTQAMWMVMDEALRTGNRALFDEAAATAAWMVEGRWDRQYGGMANIIWLGRPDYTDWSKYLWGQVETLNVLMKIAEHTADPWAIEWFDRLYSYAYSVFPDKEYGNWFTLLGRDGKYGADVTNAEFFHRPRYVLNSLDSLDRLIRQGGVPSGLPDNGALGAILE